MEESNLKPYFEFKETLEKSSKLATFKEATLRIEEYLRDPIKYKENAEVKKTDAERDADAEFNKLRETDPDDGSVAASDANESSIFNNTAELSDNHIQPTPAPAKQARSETKSVRKPAAAKKERASLPLKFKVAPKVSIIDWECFSG